MTPITRIIGFEGIVDESIDVTYGAAAIALDDGIIINSFTGIRQSVADLDPSEALTRFKTEWELDRDVTNLPVVVVAVRREGFAFAEELILDRGRLGGYLGTKREKPFTYVLLQDRAALAQYADEVAWNCVEAFLDEKCLGEDALRLVRSALVLAPRDALLLALRAHLASDKNAARRTAERLLDSDKDASNRYAIFLSACERSLTDAVYFIKYEEGDQRIGGIDLEAALTQLEALKGVRHRLEPGIREILPFVESDQLPDLRFQSLKAASAELGFGVLGKNMRERVLRYLELELLARIFRGEVPAELAKDEHFIQELRAITNPPGGGIARHRPIGADDLEPMVVDIEPKDDRLLTENSLRMFGFVQGFYREVRRAEIRLASEHTEAVSVEDDGFGTIPLGVEILRSGLGLFRPAIFALLRRGYASGRLRWSLQRVSLVSEEEGQEIDTLPSSVVPKGLFSPGDRLPLVVRTGVVHVGGFSAVHATATNFDGAKHWLREWQTDVSKLEFTASERPGSTWYVPAAFPDWTSLMRVVFVLRQTPTPTSVSEVIQKINQHFDIRVRRNNTWRTIRDNAEFFQVEDETIELSKAGHAWGRVLDRFLVKTRNVVAP